MAKAKTRDPVNKQMHKQILFKPIFVTLRTLMPYFVLSFLSNGYWVGAWGKVAKA
jgi:hypothetical protein